MAELRIGTASWKYPSWHGLVYSAPKGIDYLAEYAARYDTVEVDQWFWSLFGSDKVRLPSPRDVESYRAAVPDTFRVSVKVPNAITLTHFYRKAKSDPLVPNPWFLSRDLFERFVATIEPLRGVLDPVMRQSASWRVVAQPRVWFPITHVAADGQHCASWRRHSRAGGRDRFAGLKGTIQER